MHPNNSQPSNTCSHTGPVVPACIQNTTLLDLQPPVDVLSNTVPPSGHTPTMSIPQHTLATCRVLGMLRQAAWLLVHVGVRAAHLYLYSCAQQKHTADKQGHVLTKDAYHKVERGVQSDHGKIRALRDLLCHWGGVHDKVCVAKIQH